MAATVERIELATARSAAGLAIVADSFRGYFESNGVLPARLRRVRTWTRETSPTEPPSAARARLGWRAGDFVCVHAGNMGHKQDLDNILDAARLILPQEDIRIALVGDGNDRSRLEQRARDMNLTNVSFLDVQPTGEYEALLAAADLLLVNQRAALGDMSLPSKLTSYFAAARPVVAAVDGDGETAREMRAANAGPVVVPGNAQALADGINSVRDHPQQAAIYRRSAHEYAKKVLSSDAILKEYERFVLDLAP